MRIITPLFTSFLLLASISPLQAQPSQTPATVTGRVIDVVTHEPLPGAQIQWTEPNPATVYDVLRKSAVTGPNGTFELKNVKAENENKLGLTITYIGYQQQYYTVTLVPGETTDITIGLNPSETVLSSVEIIGTSERVSRNLPGTATKLAPLEVRRINPLGTQELLTHVPGVIAASDDGFGNSRMSIGIRGLNPRRSTRVLILEDGIPIQPALYVYPLMYYNPPVERLDQLEVIKGSGTIKYGPHTMGGVVNYITKRPRETFGGSVQLTGGTNAYRSVYTELGGFGTAQLRPEVQLIYKGGSGFREHNEFSQFNGTVKLHWLPSERKNIYFKLNGNYEDNNATYTGLTEYSFRTNPHFNPKRFDNFKVLRGSFDVISTNQVSDRFTASTKAYATWFKRDWWREDDVFVQAETYVPGGPINEVPYYTQGNLIRVGNGQSNFGNLRTFYTGGVERNYNYRHQLFGTRSNLSFGGRVHWERFQDRREIGSAPDARHNQAILFTKDEATGEVTIVGKAENWETNSLALYAHEELQLTEKLQVSPGVRVEAFEQERIDLLNGSRYQDKTTVVPLPGLGLNYKLGRFNLFGGIHRGFTPPSSSSLAILNFQQTATALDVKAEKSWNKELGLRGTTGLLAFEAAAFHLSIQDVVAASTSSVFQNLGKAQTYGLETELRLNLSRQASALPDFFVTGTVLRTEIISGILRESALQSGPADVSGKELPYAPRLSYTAGLSKTIASELLLSAEVQYLSRQFSDYENLTYIENRGDTGPVPAYYLLNASASYQVTRKWYVFAAGKNLLDSVYIGSRLHSDPFPPGPGENKASTSSGILPGARRQVNLGVRYSF